MNGKYVAVEVQTLMGDSRPTYVVDIVNVREGVANHGNLRSCDNVHLARQIARDIAKQVPCRVVDETTVAQQ